MRGRKVGVYDISHKVCVVESPEMHVEKGGGTCCTLRPMNQHIQPAEGGKRRVMESG